MQLDMGGIWIQETRPPPQSRLLGQYLLSHHFFCPDLWFPSTFSVHSLIHSFTHSLIHSLTHSLIHSFTHSLIHSLIHSLAHSLSLSLIHNHLPDARTSLAQAVTQQRKALLSSVSLSSGRGSSGLRQHLALRPVTDAGRECRLRSQARTS